MLTAMNKQHSITLLIAGLVFCGACSTVQQAPVVERQEADIDTNGADRTAERATPDPDTGDDVTGTWTELPQPGETQLPGTVETEALAEPGRISENPAVIALLDDTDLRFSQGDAEGPSVPLNGRCDWSPGTPGCGIALQFCGYAKGSGGRQLPWRKNRIPCRSDTRKYVRPMLN